MNVQMTTRKNPAGWCDSPWLIASLVVLAGMPLWWPDIPPLVDLLGHLGHYAVQVDGGNSPTIARWFSVEWRWVSNLGVDLLVQLMAPLLGVESAAKAVVISIPMLMVAGFLWVAKEVHGRLPPTVFYALPLAWGYYFHFGFVNQALSLALAFLAFALWLRYGREARSALGNVLFALIALIVWTSHVFGWAVLCVLAFCAEFIHSHNAGNKIWVSLTSSVRRSLVLALPLILIMAGIGRKYSADPQYLANGWFQWDMKLFWLGSVLRDRWIYFDFASLCILILIVALGLSFWRKRGMQNGEKMLALAAFAFTLLFFILPHGALGSFFVDMRILPVALAAFILSVDYRGRYSSMLAVIGIVFFLARVGGHAWSFLQYDSDYKMELLALQHIPSGSRVISLVGKPCNSQWARHRLDHLPSLALVRRESFVNNQWDGGVGSAFLMSVQYDAGKFASDPSHFVIPSSCAGSADMTINAAISQFPRDAFDYLWVIQQPEDKADFSEFELVWQLGRSSLWRIVHSERMD